MTKNMTSREQSLVDLLGFTGLGFIFIALIGIWWFTEISLAIGWVGIILIGAAIALESIFEGPESIRSEPTRSFNEEEYEELLTIADELADSVTAERLVAKASTKWLLDEYVETLDRALAALHTYKDR